MDFIERLFDVAPDAGNGSIELASLLVLGVVAIVVVSRRWISRRLVGKLRLN